MEEFQHLKIQLEEISLATNNFDETRLIGSGGFGKVYAGALSRCKDLNTVAFKRLDRKHGQGDPEFWKEIMMLSRYRHDNLIALLGFCNEGNEMVLVYEHASRGSLDRHLKDAALPWMQRLKICLGAAKGLRYLHDPDGSTHQRVLHCDIKSSNILLDEKWNAKVSDFGLSKIGPANQQYSVLVTNTVGTPGYCDPLYMETYFLTKESDVYSFGVVLFEVLCGRLCFEYRNGRLNVLVPKWKQIYEQKKLKEIVFQELIQQMNPSSLEAFSNIAYQCLHKSRAKRPTMSQVVQKLEIALEFQEWYEGLELPVYYKEMIQSAVPTLNYTSLGELKMLFERGTFLNSGKTWFSINPNGVHCELISIAECMIPVASGQPNYQYYFDYNSRFDVGGCRWEATFRTDWDDGKFKTRVRTQFLSPFITYKVNLVFKFKDIREVSSTPKFVLEYKLRGETECHNSSYLGYPREDGWLMAELYQFTSDTRYIDLEILFCVRFSMIVEGFEFRPLDKVEQEVFKDEEVDIQSISDSDTYWEQKLPNDYEEIIKWSKDGVQWTTKKELYSILCKGFLINNGEEWFSLAKNGKKCYMLPARVALHNKKEWSWKSLPESRFGEAAYSKYSWFTIECKIKSQLLSPQTTYASYLVYKLPENHSATFKSPMEVIDKGPHSADWAKDKSWYIYLLGPQTPVMRQNDVRNTYNSSNTPKIKGLPRQRSDGWMEVCIWEFQNISSTEMISMHVKLSGVSYMEFQGLIVESIVFKPM